MSHIPPPGGPYYGYQPPPGGSYAYVPVSTPMMMPVPVYHPPPPPHPPHPPPYSVPPQHQPPYSMPPHQPTYSMPPEPQQPTVITNYIYQPPTETVTVVEAPPPQPLRPLQAIAGIAEICLSEVNKVIGTNNNNQQNVTSITHVYNQEPVLDWVPATTNTASSLSHRAFVGGKEGWDGSPLWVIRAHHSGEFVPGKLSIKHRSAYIPHGGREVPVHNFEVLCAPQNSLRWVPSSNGQVPAGAIAAGNSHSGETLYVARARHLRSTTPGKVHPSHSTAYISFGGSEIQYRNYDVLCKFVG